MKQLSKPLASQMKQWVKKNEQFADFCAQIGEFSHQVMSQISIRSAGLKVVTVKPLPREDAVADGVGYASEVFVFSIATSVLVYEYQKSEASNAQKALRAKDKEANFKIYLNSRFKEIDSKIAELDERQHRLENDVAGLKEKRPEPVPEPEPENKRPTKRGLLW